MESKFSEGLRVEIRTIITKEELPSSDKIQRILVEFQYVYNENDLDPEMSKPLEGEDLASYIEEEAHMGNFFVRKSIEEDYKGTRDKDYESIVEEA